jgi:hypothetical protein
MRPRVVHAAAPLAAAAALLPGCLGEPPLDERWTLLEVTAGPDVTSVTPGTPAPVSLTARITFRELLTGFVIAEVRQSETLSVGDVGFENTDDRLAMARDVDRILSESTSLGFAARAVTGFDHLVQEIPLTIDSGFMPPSGEGAAADSAAAAAVGPARGIFLLVYFGDVEEVEMANGDEVEVVTPRPSEPNEILSAGVELAAGGS